MFTELIITGFSIGLYAMVILSFAKGWRKLENFHVSDNSTEDVFVTVLVPFRNEKENLKKLTEKLKSQNYSNSSYEIILINDHSEDDSEKQVDKQKHDNLILINLNNNEKGKKEALIKGFRHAKGELILTTDADCIPEENWIRTFAAYYKKHHPDLMASFVAIDEKKGLLKKTEALEFLSLIASSAGSIGIKKPIMVNGANFAYAKRIINYPEQQLKSEKASGDDIYLLMEQKKLDKKKIHFIKAREAMVKTQAQPGIKKLISQRKRWASKTKTYRDKDIILTALSVFFLNLMLLISLISGLFNPSFLIIFATGLLLKTLIDLVLLIPFLKFLNKKYLLLYFPVAQLIYPFYSVIIGFISQFTKFNWKGRTYS
jgi:cellulose synthase/poly-beta-1,6-N-acetylglucosamine synthase-like glycosyltransferase